MRVGIKEEEQSPRPAGDGIVRIQRQTSGRKAKVFALFQVSIWWCRVSQTGGRAEENVVVVVGKDGLIEIRRDKTI